MKLLVATHNQGKVKEIAALLADAGIECLTLDDAEITFDVEETATTFIGNATLKATQYAQMTGLITLADDSGLEVDALDGAPGVYTARFGGKEITQPQRNQLLLDKIEHIEAGSRAARFRCVMVLANTDGTVIDSREGTLEGTIAHAPQGSHGFGYDPVFFVPEKEKTLAELDSAEKHAISHRGNALRAIIPIIRQAIQ